MRTHTGPPSPGLSQTPHDFPQLPPATPAQFDVGATTSVQRPVAGTPTACRMSSGAAFAGMARARPTNGIADATVTAAANFLLLYIEFSLTRVCPSVRMELNLHSIGEMRYSGGGVRIAGSHGHRGVEMAPRSAIRGPLRVFGLADCPLAGAVDPVQGAGADRSAKWRRDPGGPRLAPAT